MNQYYFPNLPDLARRKLYLFADFLMNAFPQLSKINLISSHLLYCGHMYPIYILIWLYYPDIDILTNI